MTPPSWSLQHRFVAGLGFRTRWTYRACNGHERWLPTVDDRCVEDGGWIAARQAVALRVGAIPRSVGRRRRNLDEQALTGLLKDWMPNAQLHGGALTPSPTAIEQALILDALFARIAASDLVLLRYAVGEGSPHWCLVSGTETTVCPSNEGPPVSATDRLLALLLIDPGLPAVWSCGYNARLEATAESLVRRTLDGGLAQLRIVSWLAVRLRPVL